MKKLIAALAVCIALPVIAIEVSLTDEEKQLCEEQGGCVFATRQHILTLLERAFSEGVKRGKEQCSV